jgi:transposase
MPSLGQRVCAHRSIACAAAADRKKAICAVAASMLTRIYHMLKNGTKYKDLGADHFDRRSK